METKLRNEHTTTVPLAPEKEASGRSFRRVLKNRSFVLLWIGISLAMVNIPAQTLLQEQAPEEGRGRVFSIQSMIYNAGSLPVLLFAGAIADTLLIELVMYGLAAAPLAFRWWYGTALAHWSREGSCSPLLADQLMRGASSAFSAPLHALVARRRTSGACQRRSAQD
jgi:predicted permease